MGKPCKTQSYMVGDSQDKPHNLGICCLALPQPVSLLPRPCLASHLSCLGSLCLAGNPYCLCLGKNASTTSLNSDIFAKVISTKWQKHKSQKWKPTQKTYINITTIILKYLKWCTYYFYVTFQLKLTAYKEFHLLHCMETFAWNLLRFYYCVQHPHPVHCKH